MDQNIRLLEPNMAMFLQDNQLKFYNLIYNRTNKGDRLVSPSIDTTGYENYLLVRVADGTMPMTSYPTLIELQTQVDSLDYDGIYFWSVQALNSTPYYPGTIIRRWQIDPEQYGASCAQAASFPGFSTAKSICVEYYNFPIKEGIDPYRKMIKVDPAYKYALERLRVGQEVKIGPNIHGEEFWGTITRIEPYPYDSDWPVQWWEIEFNSFFNTSYVPGQNCFIEARLFVIMNDGNLWEVEPKSLTILSTKQSTVFKGVDSLAFSVVNHQPTINIGNRTASLFFTKGMNLFAMPVKGCMDADNDTPFVACKSMPAQSYDLGNTYIPVYEMRVRNDSPETNPNYPQYYLLQHDYREGSTVSTWPALNYVINNMPAQPTHMVLNMSPAYLAPSGLTYCRCTVLDDYMMPCAGITVGWSVSNVNAGKFLTATGTLTNSSGIAYATFSGAGVIPFPSYIYATTSL